MQYELKLALSVTFIDEVSNVTNTDKLKNFPIVYNFLVLIPFQYLFQFVKKLNLANVSGDCNFVVFLSGISRWWDVNFSSLQIRVKAFKNGPHEICGK